MRTLSVLLALPAMGAAGIAMLPRSAGRSIRVWAMLGAGLTLTWALALTASFDVQEAGLQFYERVVWNPRLGTSYALGLDGLSLPMVLLGALRLTLKTDYRIFFSSDNPQLQAFEQLQNTYTKTDNVLFAVAPKDGTVFTRDTLAAIAWLTHACWQIPYSLRVDSLTNYQHTRAEGDDLIVADLVSDPATLDAAQLESIRDIAIHEPLLVNR